MVYSIKKRLSIACCICVIMGVSSLDAIERIVAVQANPLNKDQHKERVLTVLHNLKELIQTRAPRPSGECIPGSFVPAQSSVDRTFLAQIKCILCQLKDLTGKVDHEEVWSSLIDAIACSQVEQPDVPQDYAAAAAQIAAALTEILNRIGCADCETIDDLPPDILGALCYIATQISELENALGILFAIKSELDVIDSKIDVIESELTSCCDEMNGKLDTFGSVIGSPFESIDCEAILDATSCDDINGLDLSVIQWLKAIYLKCNNLP